MRCIPSKEDMQRALEARHGKDLQQKFTNSTVAICGLGGLGSNIAVSLARAGIGKSVVDSLKNANALGDMPESNQISLF